MPKVLCPFPHRAVPRYLIVLDCLTGCQQAGIEGRSRCFLHQSVSFLDKALYRVALLARRLLAYRLEHLLELLDLSLGFLEVVLGRLL